MDAEGGTCRSARESSHVRGVPMRQVKCGGATLISSHKGSLAWSVGSRNAAPLLARNFTDVGVSL